MPGLPRNKILNPNVRQVVHCWATCVRQAYLYGWDPYLKKDCRHRKVWVRDGLRRLAGSMAVDVLDYAVLDNHLHTVLRNRPDLVATWSDEEVARRWWQVCPERTEEDGSPSEPTRFELHQLLADPEQLADYRERLSSLSWFMRLLTQPIARRANREDGRSGHFVAKRFDSEPIESEAQLLTCSMYVDLNLIRAGMASTPESSEYTSAYDRIRGRLRRCRAAGLHATSDPADKADESDEDAWLAPIYLDPSSQAYQNPAQAAAGNPLIRQGSRTLFPDRVSDQGFLPLTEDQYLELLDWTGRQLRADKRGAIPAGLAPILERLDLDPDSWVDTIQLYAPRTRSPYVSWEDHPDLLTIPRSACAGPVDRCVPKPGAPPCRGQQGQTEPPSIRPTARLPATELLAAANPSPPPDGNATITRDRQDRPLVTAQPTSGTT
jgi:hypothetical protein